MLEAEFSPDVRCWPSPSHVFSLHLVYTTIRIWAGVLYSPNARFVATVKGAKAHDNNLRTAAHVPLSIDVSNGAGLRYLSFTGFYQCSILITIV